MKHPYCLVTRPICAGGLPVNCWQLIEMAKPFDWVSITECDGFTGERLRIVTLSNEKAIANATKENLQFEDVK